MLPTHPHRMSSSELERALYISNDPFHKAFFEREEPGLNTDNGEERTKSTSSKTGDFIQAMKEVNLAQDTSKILVKNNKRLVNELIKLNKEMEYTVAEKDILNILDPVPEI